MNDAVINNMGLVIAVVVLILSKVQFVSGIVLLEQTYDRRVPKWLLISGFAWILLTLFYSSALYLDMNASVVVKCVLRVLVSFQLGWFIYGHAFVCRAVELDYRELNLKMLRRTKICHWILVASISVTWIVLISIITYSLVMIGHFKPNDTYKRLPY